MKKTNSKRKRRGLSKLQDAIKQRQPANNKPPGNAPPGSIRTLWVRIILVTVFTSLLLCLSLYTGFFGLLRLDDFIDKQFWSYAEGYVDKSISSDIAIIAIEEEPDKNGRLGKFGVSWRQYHANLINALAGVGTKVIVFDMYFEDASPENDEILGRAIQSVAQSGTKVVLGTRNYRMIDDKPVPQITQRLASYLDESNWGLIEIGGAARNSSLIGKVKLGQNPSEELPGWISTQRQQIVPSLPLQAAIHFWGGPQQQPIAVFDKERDRIDVQAHPQAILNSIPVTPKLDFTFDIADKNNLNKISYPYYEVLDNLNNHQFLSHLFGQKIVIVGVRASQDLRHVSRTEEQYGMEILASVTSNLIQEVYIRPLSDGYQYVIILVMSFVGALLPTRFGNFMKYRIPIRTLILAEVKVDVPLAVGAVSLFYILSAFLVYVQTRRTMSIQYHLAALIITFILVKFTLRSIQSQPVRGAT